MASESSSKPAKGRRKSNTALPHDPEDRALQQHIESAKSTYGRGGPIRTRSVKDKKLRSNLRTLENKYKDATVQAKDAEILLDNTAGLLEPENELERTYKVRQDEIRGGVGIETAKKGFELRLDTFGPYDVCQYTRNGRDLLIAGRKGHVACMDWRDGKLGCELHLNETIRDATWLHNNQSFAVAQRKNTYIYARDGVEMHKLKGHTEAAFLEFLPYHFLLTSVANNGRLQYTDTSTGQMVADLKTRLGQPTAMCQNPHNAILHIGHQQGQVTLWSPNSSEPLVKLLPHHGPVRALAVDRSGRYMVSTGQDRKLAVWDIRMFKEVHAHHLHQPGSTLSISDRNLTAVGYGTSVAIYRPELLTHPETSIKIPAPYMQWGGEGLTISSTQFCPFEDVLGISHNRGISSILVPGSGEANPDSLEYGLNPFETLKQRREAEVHALLEKLQPEMISLNPNFIGNLDVSTEAQKKRMREEDMKEMEEKKIEELKKRGRGRNSALRRHMRKQTIKGQRNVIDEAKVRARDQLHNNAKRQQERLKNTSYGPALARFATKGN